MVKKSKAKTVIIILLAIFLVVGLAFAGYWFLIKPKNTSSLAVSEEVKKQAEVDDVEKARSDENKNSVQGKTPDNAAQTQANSSGNIGGNISSSGQAGQNVYINAIVTGTTTGTCKLTMTRNSKKVEKSAPIGLQVSYYICKGFNISSSEFTEKGEWEAIIEAAGSNSSGKSETRKITIQ